MKNCIFILLIFLSGNLFASDYNIFTDMISDTIVKHDVKIIDEHMIITDSVIIEKTIFQEESNPDKSFEWKFKIYVLISILLILFSFINHHLKNKKNGTKLH